MSAILFLQRNDNVSVKIYIYYFLYSNATQNLIREYDMKGLLSSEKQHVSPAVHLPYEPFSPLVPEEAGRHD